MPFFDHLAELRRRLVIIFASVGVVSLVVYGWAWQIYDFVMKPILPYLKEAGAESLVTLGPFEGFTLRFRVSLYASIVIVSPIIIWQVMAFFLPALQPRERKYVIPTFAAMLTLFLGGIAFCYTIVQPKAFEWMIGQLGGAVGLMPDAARWFGGVMLLLLAFGVGFQIPVIVFYLMIFDIVPYKTLRANWRVAYVVLMITSAIATPDWSPVTMGALFGALVILYEASMLLARIVLSRRIAEQRRLEALEA
jgi:sec-independent protein translocase protein TatC